jgi:hypothetical protein
VLPRFSLMLPYFTVSSVVGLIEGTTSGITPACWNTERIETARDAEMLEEVGHVSCLSFKRGEA